MFVLEGLPETFDDDIIDGSAFGILADADSVIFKE